MCTRQQNQFGRLGFQRFQAIFRNSTERQAQLVGQNACQPGGGVIGELTVGEIVRIRENNGDILKVPSRKQIPGFRYETSEIIRDIRLRFLGAIRA
ncbi:hypothetical protein D3C87_1711900 [compost metagenome]